MATQLKQYRNSFANPNNRLKLGNEIDCGCDVADNCQANFTAVWDATAVTITFTGASFILATDAIVVGTGVQVTVQDKSGNTVGPTAGDETAPIVVAIGALTVDETFRIDYEVTTTAGCVSTVSLFIKTGSEDGVTVSPDPYFATR
jgi:type 1 fimbria pilin